MRLVLLFSLWPSLVVGQDVLQLHLHGSRDGLYTDPLFTLSAVPTIHRDLTFSAPLPGPTYAQPLYITNGAAGRPTLIVATEQNMILALDASNGSQIWAST